MMDSFSFAVNQFAYTLALITWVGCSFMALLAGPVIFKVSPNRKAAGDFNGLLLSRLNQIKYVCLIVASLTIFIRYVQWDASGDADVTVRLTLLGIRAGAALIFGLVVSPLTRRARAHTTVGGETTSAFKRLHGLAMLLFLIEITTGISIWFFN